MQYITYILLDVSVWSIAVYFYELCCILTCPQGILYSAYFILYIVRHIVQLVIVQYRARAHAVTLVVFFQVTEKG